MYNIIKQRFILLTIGKQLKKSNKLNFNGNIRMISIIIYAFLKFYFH